jgi:CxxC motif-containing protein (DUF1111 family)
VRRALLLALVVAIAGCRAKTTMPYAERSGGSGTTLDATKDAFSQPLGFLGEANLRQFFVGNSLFNLNWVSAPASVSERDGLGPLFNARSCSGCHFKDGRGRPPEPGQPMSTMLVRVSVPGKPGAPTWDPTYGDQLQGLALPGISAEADVLVDYEDVTGTFDDGERYTLRRPRYRIERLGYGPVSERLLVSPRVPPALVGLGLLEAVPQRELEALADPNDADGNGISGRLQRVPDRARGGALAPGRFGWKAEQPSVLQQCATAFVGDLGITSSLFPDENHTSAQPGCRESPSGGSPEIDDGALHAVALYVRALAVPARRNVDERAVRHGEALFGSIGCADCHVPTLRTGPSVALPEIPSEEIHAYTDLLLHDLGEGLADGRATYEATGSEWRTPPLWGIGLLQKVNGHAFLLHDGRARGPIEAVLWHGGEALRSKRAFLALARDERAALRAFLESL